MENAIAFRTIMNAPYPDHPDEDALERFLLNQSEEGELEIVETHVLACEACVTRLETLELNIAATKQALRIMQTGQTKLLEKAPVSTWQKWFSLPRLSWAGAAIAACATVLLVASVPSKVDMTAYRGSETMSVKEWRPLQMHLTATDITPGPVTVEVVDDRNSRVWQGQSVAKDDVVDVRVPRITKEGIYFVRIYSAAEVKREFSVRVMPLF